MIIECQICEAITKMDKFPDVNICPVCLHIGSLSVVRKPTKGQLKRLEELRRESE